METSILMALVEVTPRTLPTQENVETALQNGYAFYTDRYSLVEAFEQITTSYKNAVDSLSIAKRVAERDNVTDPKHLSVIFIKALAEKWYGREETLRWGDAILSVGDKRDFYEAICEYLDKKRDAYFKIINKDAQKITLTSSQINSYWVRPDYKKDLTVEVRVIDNRMTLQEFFNGLQSIVNTFYKEKITMNDVIDFYHLFSLYYDSKIEEVWSCNQQFVKRHEKYLKGLESDRFAEVFKRVKIKRIK